jgi:hypothetical protein
MSIALRLTPLLLAGGLVFPAVEGAPEERPGADMAQAARALLNALTPQQRQSIQFGFTEEERLNWHFVPRERRGLPMGRMTAEQQGLARALLATGLGPRGMRKAEDIIALELVLREMGGDPAVRDPGLYFVSVFGDPGPGEPWGWRFEGHHLSLNFTVVEGAPVAWAPAFMGANPGEVREGARTGLRALAPEEDLARELGRSLDPAQRAVAVFDPEAPRDIITGNALEIDPLEPAGIFIADLHPEQVDRLVNLLDEYLSRMADDLSAARRAAIHASDLSRIAFAWAGSLEEGEPHYYRIQGPSFLVEFDNTQNNANHIHSVWRDFDGDFGRDLLREHYRDGSHEH